MKLPITNLPKKKFIAPNDAPLNFRGSLYEQFFDTMTTSQNTDEIDLFGKKLPKKAQVLIADHIFEKAVQ